MAAPKRDRIEPDSVRFIRLWLPNSGQQMRHYYYSDPLHAQERALLLVAWQHVNEPIEVYNGHTGRVYATYVQRVDGRIDYERF